MEKVVKIGKQEVTLSNNIAWTMEYRDQFGKDIVPAIMPLLATFSEAVSTVVAETGSTELTVVDIANAVQGRSMEILLPLYQVEFVDVIINITWALAKTADEDIAPPKQWVRQFDCFPVDTIAPVVFDMVLKGCMSLKNLKRLKTAGASLKTLQPSD